MLARAPRAGACAGLCALRRAAAPCCRGRAPGAAPARALRETAGSDPDAVLSPLHLARLRLTQPEYSALARKQVEARSAYLAAMADPTVPNAAKHDLEASYHVSYGRALFKCRGCMLAPALCVCSALARRAPGAAGGPPHRLAVYMHHKEYGRASNTGCLLAPAVGASIHVSGLAADEAALGAALEAAGDGGAAVLWPGEGAVSLEELRESVPPERWDAGLLLVAIDATWGSARKLVKRVPPGVPRLALPAAAFAPGRSLLFPVRKYEGPCAERYCTYEAAIALLDALGALAPGEREVLTLNLKLKVDALLKHKNRRAVYGGETADALAAAHAALLAELRRD